MNILTVVKIIFSAVGLILLGATVFIYINTAEFIKASATAEGVVVHVERVDDVYYPTVRFQTSDNKNIEFRSSTGSNPPSHSVGDNAEVMYSSDDPYNARINTFFSLWFGALLTGVIGLVFFFIVIVITLIQRQKKIKFVQYED